MNDFRDQEAKRKHAHHQEVENHLMKEYLEKTDIKQSELDEMYRRS